MGLTETLLNQGYTLPGVPVNKKINRLGDLVQSLNEYQAKQKMDQQEEQKKIQEEMSTYQTLRDNGYSPAKAHQIVLSGKLPADVPELGPKEQKTQADIAQTNAETAKIQAETDNIGQKKSSVEAKILNKIANGDELLPGEQRIYDDVIKKRNQTDTTDSFNQFLNEPITPNTNQPESIPMIAPDGKRWKIKKEKVEEAISRGFKKVQ